ncbi:MAG: alpha/beta fold hydrolase [Acidobacteriota bacterium]|nr:alpha/beta fold hydrolase [Acidobacteriota bacterium]
MPTAQVNGIDLYYEVHGEGTPLLLVPGLGADVRLFAGVVGELRRRYRVVAFDPRGSGRSEKPDGPYSIETMADDAAALLAELGVTKAAVVGYSMGGRVALALALRHPEAVDRLVLAATSARTPARSSPWRWFVVEVVGRFPLFRAIDGQPRAAFEHQRQASRRFDCADRLGSLSVPALVLHGTRDRIVPVALARELEAGIPGARLVTVPGGHGALLTFRRRRFVSEITDFVGV